jgi:hypothetical protein
MAEVRFAVVSTPNLDFQATRQIDLVNLPGKGRLIEKDTGTKVLEGFPFEQ